jgi:hypothetical protein
MREIYIRKMRYEDAKDKLDREIHAAFMDGETLVEVIHGVGEGVLRQLTLDTIRCYDFLLLSQSSYTYDNPGTTRVEILAPDKSKLKKLKKNK